MQVPRPSDAARVLFAAVMPDDPRVVVKPMFGEPARLAEWVARAFDEVAALPPKAPKPARAPKPAKPKR